ncbi:MAG: hypothetical protein J7L26_09575 [Candidatus Aminicenantes bacterium]|nr:hypothetical protein [Candidatus Aminicenantes bacterium]
MKCETIIRENSYVSKDYLIDYSLFYSRSFKEYPRFTQRLHFFSKRVSLGDLKEFLSKGYTCKITPELNRHYLGFTVIKPTLPSSLGKTVLKTYPEREKGNTRHFLKKRERVSFCGIPLEVHSLPFQEQDQAVSACATVSLWICLHALQSLYHEGEVISPGEITQLAFSIYPFPKEPAFPSEGLLLPYQILGFFRKLDWECIEYDLEKGEVNIQFFEQLIKTHIILARRYFLF